MPMKFSHSTFLQMLLRTSNITTGWDISDDLLARPTTIKDPGLGIAEAPFEVWNGSSICALSAEIVGVLEIYLVIRSAWDIIRKCVQNKGARSPRIGPPFPLASIGSPCANWDASLLLRVLPDATAANAHESREIYERCMMEFGRSDQTWCHEKWRGTVYAMRASTVLKYSGTGQEFK